jgi:uncharacterized protein
MDATTFANPAIATIITEQFVPVRVTPDARPDIAERYGLGAWPTTAFLSPAGQVLGGGTFITVERMPGVLDQVSAACAAAPDRLEERVPAPVTVMRAGRPPSAADLLASFDAAHGGFGAAPKFPHVAALRLALAGSTTTGRTARDEEIVVRTLDAMGWGGLFDESEGGFFCYATATDWSTPHPAKHLDDQAALVRLYLDAAEILGVARFRDRAADTLGFVQAAMADPAGGWYCARWPGEPLEQPGPAGLYADVNATMASAALHAARAFHDDGLARFAVTSLERVLLACYRPGDGVSHFHDGAARQVRGLLADQVAMAEACLDAHEATGQLPYLMMAEELMHFAVRVLWDEARGAFADRVPDADGPPIGLLGTPVHPFVVNCAAAGVLRRLARASGTHEFSAYADRVLTSMAPVAAAQGLVAAHYLLAVSSRQ